LLFESWVENKAKEMEEEAMRLTPEQQLDSILEVTKDLKKDANAHMTHLLTSLSHTLAKDDQKAVSDLHKYFDYNMRSKQTRSNIETGAVEFVSWAVKVHQPALNLANLRLRLNNIDESLLSVMESIKISQNKNDHESILQCLVWLQQILGALGNKAQERRLLEHIIQQAEAQ
jgi:hypothetical protein